MKNRINKLTLAIVVAVICISNVATAQSLTDGLMGYWPFTGNAVDSVAMNNNGTVYGATLAKDRFGNDSSAYYFDGNGDYITCGTHSSIRSSTHSVSFWFRYTDTSQNSFVVNCQSGANGEWGSNVMNSANVGWHSSISSGANNHDIGHWSRKKMNDDQWHMFTTVYDKTTNRITVYLDGCLSGYNNVTGSSGGLTSNDSCVFKAGVPWVFGASSYYHTTTPNYGPKYYKGYLDDVRIYNRVLTPLEVRGLFLEGTAWNVQTTRVYDTTYVSVTDTLLVNVKWLSTGSEFNQAKVYPNPTKEKVIIDFGDYLKVYGHKVAINNSVGQQVFSKDVTSKLMEIDLNSLGSAGTYLLIITDKNLIILSTKKLILQ